MSSFGELIADAQSMGKDTSNDAKAVIKRGINVGLTRIRKQMKKTKYASKYRTFNIVGGQSQYQTPEGATRVSRIGYTNGGTFIALNRIDSEAEWDQLKGSVGSTGQPDSYFMTGADTFELYPTPGSNAIGTLKYQGKAKELSADDYTTGTVTVEAGSQIVIGAGTDWTGNMVGRYIKLESSSTDRSDYYRVISVSSPTELAIENYYDGADQAGLNYLIGECPQIPEEYHPALVDYALYRFFKWRKDEKLADTYLADFMISYTEIGEDYSNDSTSSVIPSRRARNDDTMLPTYKRVPKAV